MLKKFATLYWYLQRPRLYPQQLRDWYERLFFRGALVNHSRDEATRWCAQIAIDTAQALQKITGEPKRGSVTHIFSTVFATAQRTAVECPVRMGGPGDLDLIYWLAEHIRATRVIETGVAYGWSSLAFQLSLRTRDAARLISIDMPYPKLNNDQYVGCAVPEALRGGWQLLRYADRQGLPKALREFATIDMCHYDSDKSYRGRMWAYPRLWNALKAGGVFVSDDVGDNVAFRDFTRQIGVEPIVIGVEGKHVGVLVKPDGARR